MSPPAVRFTTDDEILRITLDRPARKNALTPESVREIIETLERVAADDSARAVLIQATGADFCGGADIVAANADREERPKTGNLQRRTAMQAHRLIDVITGVQLPVVCSVRGFAAGLGCQLALAADFTVAAETATFFEPFVARGFTPDSGATWLLPRLVGVARAKELLLLGEQVSGARAAEWGMIHRAVPDDELETATEALARRLADGPTVAIGLAKRCIHGALGSNLIEAMEKEAAYIQGEVLALSVLHVDEAEGTYTAGLKIGKDTLRIGLRKAGD